MMVYTSHFLHKVNHRQEAPENAYLLYSLNGGIYWIDRKDYPNFNLEWIGVSSRPPLTLDLSSTGTHSLILDIDHYPQPLGDELLIYGIIETVLKMTLIPSVTHFTYILCQRDSHMGIHVHLPEFQIGHDDYVLLLANLQYQFQQALSGSEAFKLDILTNAMLPGAAKPQKKPYIPIAYCYVDEQHTFQVTLRHFTTEYPMVQKKFVKRKHNEKSLFRKLIQFSHLKMLLVELQQLVMPVVCSRTGFPTHALSYATAFAKEPNVSSDWEDVAFFTYPRTNEPGFISKGKTLLFNQASSGGASLKVFHQLKLNARNMTGFQTSNYALKRWYERFGSRATAASMDPSHIPEMFRNLHEMLQFEHATLSENPNPLKTIMQFNEGYYFLPVFYVLCKHYDKNSRDMAQHLYPLLDKDYHPLLDKLQAIHPKNMQDTIAELSLNTLHFCANNLDGEKLETHREKLKSIVQNNRRSLLSVTTYDQLVDFIRSVQERHLPIRVLKLRNALKKPARYIWNALKETWQETNGNSEINDHMQNLWNNVRQFYRDYKRSGGIGGPDEDIMLRFSVSNMVSVIQSDTVMERKEIQMDTHKWFLRMQDGILDLLTGHIGGVVPEFFLSDRKLNLTFPRPYMIRLCHHSPALVTLYDTLLHKSFFLQYLQALFLDREDSLTRALARTLPPAELSAAMEHDPDMTQSMLHFYVNLCKCTSFEYDLLLYLLDVLASVLVGTNYERKFFVFKGLTRNGKSKLFELMGRVLGGYYHSIQSENLSPGHAVNNASPELASTLFACRMVASEELEKRLDENRIKQITGNSHVTFRNMYEQNSGGIPTAKLFATTNNYPECKASEAFKDRVVAIPFEAEFSSDAPTQTSSQVESNTYSKDAYIVEQSYKGCFLMLYYHLKKHMDVQDGLLHYRRQPECVVEFTEDYLIHADIYIQFKLHMDVQLKPGSQTTMNEVKSAVRQFLKMTKNTSFHETDLFISFEKEFGELRQTDLHFGSQVSVGYGSVLDDHPTDDPEDTANPPSQKKMKMDIDSSVVFYDGVVIKNLRRPNVDD